MHRYLKLAALSPDLESARAATATSPTDAQIEAGNYAKGKVKIRGFSIAIENPKGSVRKGKDKTGRPWSIRLVNDYGYFLGSKSADEEQVDVFIGSDPDKGKIWVIDQHVDGVYDEPKVVFGEPTEEAAKATYRANYSPGWDGIGAIREMSAEELRTWMGKGAPEIAEKEANIATKIIPSLFSAGAKIVNSAPGIGAGLKQLATRSGLRPGFKDLLQARRNVQLVYPRSQGWGQFAPALQRGTPQEFGNTLGWAAKQGDGLGHFTTKGLGGKPTMYLSEATRQTPNLPYRDILRHESMHGIQSQLKGKFPLWSRSDLAGGGAPLAGGGNARDGFGSLVTELQAFKAQNKSWREAFRGVGGTWQYGKGTGYHADYFKGADLPWYHPWRVAAGIGKHASQDLDTLLAAKEHSDNGRYAAKAELVRDMLQREPGAWEIDSQEGRFVGLTHKPTGFRIHLPQSALPSGVEIAKQAAVWRQLPNLLKVLKKAPVAADTVAGARQEVGKFLGRGFDTLAHRAPNYVKDTGANVYRARLNNPALHGHNLKLRNPHASWGGSPAAEDAGSHLRLFDKLKGQEFTPPSSTTLGDTLFRGSRGGNPWAGGYFNGRMHHATADFGEASRGIYTGYSPVTAVHNFRTAPQQVMGRDLSLETNMMARTPGRVGRFENALGLPSGGLSTQLTARGKPLAVRGQHYETAILPRTNPYMGTTVTSPQGHSKFVSSSSTDSLQRLRNYLKEMNAPLRSGRGGPNDWATKLPVVNPRLERLRAANPNAFDQLMGRRIDKHIAAPMTSIPR